LSGVIAGYTLQVVLQASVAAAFIFKINNPEDN
jgi:hypothetical protein